MPVKPNKYKILLIALFMGMGIPGGIIFGKDSINTTVRDKLDLSNLSVPLLGTIPHVKMRDANDMVFVQESGRDAVNESFRMVRTNLDFICMQQKTENIKVIQFTSMEFGTGKTFISLNLAMTFALAGKRVALLDLDMRTATLSRLIDFPEFGISDMLNKSAMNEHYIIKDSYCAGLDIIPVGLIPPNPSELLMGSYMKLLMEKLKTMYDYIFIDSTPAELVADAVIVGQFADLSVFILRENYTDRRKLAEFKNTFPSSGKFKNIHIVLNGSDSEEPAGKYKAYYNQKSKQPLLQAKSHDSLFNNAGFLTEGSKRKS
jgi:capsular exopolysaccharide synthesis family protein